MVGLRKPSKSRRSPKRSGRSRKHVSVVLRDEQSFQLNLQDEQGWRVSRGNGVKGGVEAISAERWRWTPCFRWGAVAAYTSKHYRVKSIYGISISGYLFRMVVFHSGIDVTGAKLLTHKRGGTNT